MSGGLVQAGSGGAAFFKALITKTTDGGRSWSVVRPARLELALALS